MNTGKYITLKDISKKLGISEISLRRYIKAGRLNARLIGREYKILPSESEAFIKSFEIKKPSFKINKPVIKKELGLKPGHIHKNDKENNHKGLKPIPGLNSHVIESLIEMINQDISLDNIKNIVAEYANESLELLKVIRSEGVSDVKTTLILLIIDEAIVSLKNRRRLLKRLINNNAIIFLPLPPHLSDMLLPIASYESVFVCGQFIPPHLRNFSYINIANGTIDHSFNRPQNINSIVIEGYVENDQLYINSDVAGFMYQYLNNSLEELYIHIIPHIPPHTNFVEFDTKNFPAQILKL